MEGYHVTGPYKDPKATTLWAVTVKNDDFVQTHRFAVKVAAVKFAAAAKQANTIPKRKNGRKVK